MDFARDCSQEYVLGFWNALFDGLIRVLQGKGVVAYVDDLAGIACGNSQRKILTNVQNMVDLVHHWCCDNKMEYNISSTDILCNDQGSNH